MKNVFLAHSTISDGNMSFRYGEQAEVASNRKQFLTRNEIDIASGAIAKLVHRDDIILITEKNKHEIFICDALITSDKNLYIGILTGDCLPILLFDQVHQVIALVHAAVNNYDSIIPKTVQTMTAEFNSKPSDLLVEIGPSIGPCHYKMDLWEEIEGLLVKSGINPTQITNPRVCTYETSYFSHRRSVDKNEPEGRFLTIAKIV